MSNTTASECCCQHSDPRDCFVARHPEAKARFDDEPTGRPWNCEICECVCHNGGDEDDEVDEGYCYRCDGKRFVIVCVDDMCRGAGECMHGDGEISCPVCNKYGQHDWEF